MPLTINMATFGDWYDIVEGEQIEQGDILINCQVIWLSPESSVPLPPNEFSIEHDTLPVIVLTQTCDLSNPGKIDFVVVARLQRASTQNADNQKKIALGQRPRYHIIEAFPVANLERMIIDFGDIFVLPISYVKNVAAAHGKRPRILPPYREHLSQAFGSFFSRVALDKPIRS